MTVGAHSAMQMAMVIIILVVFIVDSFRLIGSMFLFACKGTPLITIKTPTALLFSLRAVGFLLLGVL